MLTVSQMNFRVRSYWYSNIKIVFQKLEIGAQTIFKFTALPLSVSLLPKHTQILLSPLCASSANKAADQLAAVDASLATASCGSEKKMTMRLSLLQPGLRSGSSCRRRWRTTPERSVDGLSRPQADFFWSFLWTMWKYSYKMILGRLHLLWGRHFK